MTEQSDPPKLNHIAPQWFHAAWEALRDYLRANRIVAGTNVNLTTAPGGGRLLDVEVDAQVVVPRPFDPIVSGTKVKFRPGTMNGLLPTNMFAEFTISSSGVYHPKLKCQAVSRHVSQVTIEVNSTPAVPMPVTQDAPPTSFEVSMGAIVDGKGYNAIWNAPLVYAVRYSGSTPNAAAAAVGEPLFKQWWTWGL